VERCGGHLRRAADIVKVDDVADAPVAVAEYLVVEPRTEARHDDPVSAKTGTAASAIADAGVIIIIIIIIIIITADDST